MTKKEHTPTVAKNVHKKLLSYFQVKTIQDNKKKNSDPFSNGQIFWKQNVLSLFSTSPNIIPLFSLPFTKT